MINTKCTECIFDKSEPLFDISKCSIGKKVFIHDKDQFTLGFCRYKRTENYLTFNHLDNLKEIQNEELKVTLVILDDILDESKLINTLDSIVDQTLIGNILLSTKVLDDDLSLRFDILSRYNFKWKLDNLKINDPVESEIINHIINIIETNWFYIVHAGKKVSDKILNDIYTNLSDKNSYILGAFTDINNPIELLLNKYVFATFGGNSDELWFDKIKKLEDWELLCPQIG